MLLLDTNAIIYLARDEPIADAARQKLDDAGKLRNLLVSPVSAWEVGTLVRKRRIDLTMEPLPWFETFLDRSGVRLVPLSPASALLSSFLPEPFHGDPADRMLVATARELGAVLVTRDRKILAYAEAGHLRAMAC